MTKTSGYNEEVEKFREREFPMLKDSVYLDNSGTTLYSKSLIERFSKDMMSGLYGNPHSASASSELSTSRVEDARLRLLKYFKADQAEFDLVFVPNTTSGVKLVTESFRAIPDGFAYAYHRACHTSLVGVRAEARESRCLDTTMVEDWLAGKSPFDEQPSEAPSTILFSYSTQSHMNGKRYPLSWASRLRNANATSQKAQQLYTLLDVASYAASSPLDLSDADNAPDFVVLSLYKIFGFPDLGALIVRRTAESVLRHRKYFGGGTVDMVLCGSENWQAIKNQFIHERLEDGTLPFHSIIALDAALDAHQELFGGMKKVSQHTQFLRRRLYEGLSNISHGNGQPICTLYSENPPADDPLGAGPVISFNIRNCDGSWVSLHEFEKLANLKKFHVRTGGVCSPCDVAAELSLDAWEMKRSYASGLRCGGPNDLVCGSPTGVIRASLGAMNTISDVDGFIAFISEFYCDEGNQSAATPEHATPVSSTPLTVQYIIVYPIKSCGGYRVPPSTPWEVRPEGLAWDREWCLVHEGSGQALSQKRYPKMALFHPTFDFENGLLRVKYHGQRPSGVPNEISVPLSANPDLFETNILRETPSRICGEAITAQTYTSHEINSFFTLVLGVPCLLAHFPPGGHGPGMRYSKALRFTTDPGKTDLDSSLMPGSFPLPPSPPESDSEQQSKILLSNESPILLVHTTSVDALNEALAADGKPAVSPPQFRPNIVVGPSKDHEAQHAFSEDDWRQVRIGKHVFHMLGPCRRCQMVCVDQETGERGEEPFITLAKMRRIDGKVYFGEHMTLDPSHGRSYRTIQLLDPVYPEELA